jgi:hypothetical protein
MKKLLIAISSILIALPSLAINNSLKSQNGLNIGDKIPHFDLRTESLTTCIL